MPFCLIIIYFTPFLLKLKQIAFNVAQYIVAGHLDSMLRNLVIGKLGKNGEEAVIAEAKKRFAAHCAGSATIPADLRGAVYGTVLSQGSEKEYDEMLELIKASDLHEERVRIMRSLGSVRDEKLIQKVLDYSVSVSLSYALYVNLFILS